MATELYPTAIVPYVFGSKYNGNYYYTDSINKTTFVGIVDPYKFVDYTVDTQKFTVTNKEVGRPDLISYKLYDTPVFAWLICAYNGIVDPLDEDTGIIENVVLTIPTKSAIGLLIG
jgi:hypothetical protein